MRRKCSRFTLKATIGRTLPLTPKLCMQAKAKKPMDDVMLSVFHFMNMSYEVLLLIFIFLKDLPYSMESRPSRGYSVQSLSGTSRCITQMELEMERMQDQMKQQEEKRS
jgi:hypothetical protein